VNPSLKGSREEIMGKSWTFPHASFQPWGSCEEIVKMNEIGA